MRYESYTMISKLNTKHVDSGSPDLIDIMVELSPEGQQLLHAFKQQLQWGKCRVVVERTPEEIQAITDSTAFKELYDKDIAAYSKGNAFMLTPDVFLPWADNYASVQKAWIKAHRTPEEIADDIAKHAHVEAVLKANKRAEQLLDAHHAGMKINNILISQSAVIAAIKHNIPLSSTKGHLTASVSLMTGITQSQVSVLLTTLEGVCWTSYKHKDSKSQATRYLIK